jgi:hypothetical protein
MLSHQRANELVHFRCSVWIFEHAGIQDNVFHNHPTLSGLAHFDNEMLNPKSESIVIWSDFARAHIDAILARHITLFDQAAF